MAEACKGGACGCRAGGSVSRGRKARSRYLEAVALRRNSCGTGGNSTGTRVRGPVPSARLQDIPNCPHAAPCVPCRRGLYKSADHFCSKLQGFCSRTAEVCTPASAGRPGGLASALAGDACRSWLSGSSGNASIDTRQFAELPLPRVQVCCIRNGHPEAASRDRCEHLAPRGDWTAGTVHVTITACVRPEQARQSPCATRHPEDPRVTA